MEKIAQEIIGLSGFMEFIRFDLGEILPRKAASAHRGSCASLSIHSRWVWSHFIGFACLSRSSRPTFLKPRPTGERRDWASYAMASEGSIQSLT